MLGIFFVEYLIQLGGRCWPYKARNLKKQQQKMFQGSMREEWTGIKTHDKVPAPLGAIHCKNCVKMRHWCLHEIEIIPSPASPGSRPHFLSINWTQWMYCLHCTMCYNCPDFKGNCPTLSHQMLINLWYFIPHLLLLVFTINSCLTSQYLNIN